MNLDPWTWEQDPDDVNERHGDIGLYPPKDAIVSDVIIAAILCAKIENKPLYLHKANAAGIYDGYLVVPNEDFELHKRILVKRMGLLWSQF